MALPTSGTITFAQIQAEFTTIGTASNLRAYLRGAGIVPNIPENATVPTGGTVTIRSFLGARKDLYITGAPDATGGITSGIYIAPYNSLGPVWKSSDITFSTSINSTIIMTINSGAGAWVQTGSAANSITGYFERTDYAGSAGTTNATVSTATAPGGSRSLQISFSK